jgi:hypothetical protein
MGEYKAKRSGPYLTAGLDKKKLRRLSPSWHIRFRATSLVYGRQNAHMAMVIALICPIKTNFPSPQWFATGRLTTGRLRWESPR